MTSSTLGPRTAAMQTRIATRYPVFKASIASFSQAGADATAALEETLAHLFADDAALERAVDGYAAFALDAMRRERRFETEQEYPPQSFDEATREVYLDADYMTREYLPGLLLSHHLWPHHRAQTEFFTSTFVPLLAAASATTCAEVGLGTGIYTRLLLQLLPGAAVTGYDISPAALAFATGHIAAFGLGARFRAERRDVLVDPLPPCEHVVCVEVLEHLDEPAVLLAALRDALLPGGFGFVTAALNAPNVDHIYLYRTPSAVEDQLLAAGFVIEQAFAADAYAPRRAGLPVPSVVAYIVR